MASSSSSSSVASSTVQKSMLDQLYEESGEFETPKAMKAFIHKQIAESKRFIKVLQKESHKAQGKLDDVEKLIEEMEAKRDPFEFADSLEILKSQKMIARWKIVNLNHSLENAEEEIKNFKHQLEILDAAIRPELEMGSGEGSG